jgi:hypothetical protein
MAVFKSKLSFDLLETRGSSYFFFGTYCVLSGEGSVLNGKYSLCELIIMQKSSPLKGTLFFLLSFNLLLLEFIFYRGKIDRLRRIFFKR